MQKKFAERFNIGNYYDSYDKLCEDPEVDIVYVGVINNIHKSACLKAIQNGKHVLCEKPMTMNAKQQEEVINAAKEKGVFLMEGLWTRFFPIIDRLRSEISSNAIGEIKFVNANFFIPMMDIENINSKELGGGALLNIGIYPIQLVCMLFNHEKPLSIVATGHLATSGVDECVVIALKYTNQRMASVCISGNCHRMSNTTIVGEKGVLYIPSNSWCPSELVLPNGEEVSIPILPNEKGYHRSVGLKYQAEAVRLALEQGLTEHPLMTHEQSLLIMNIMDEVRRQLKYDFPNID